MSRIASAQAVEQRQPRVRDPGYLDWLHDLPCIACLIEGRDLSIINHPTMVSIEAAHQKHTDLRGPSLGKRPSDAAACPLCTWHHRLAPDACDPAQRKFWDRLGVDVGAFCKALHDAYRAGDPGEPVVRRFAGEGR